MSDRANEDRAATNLKDAIALMEKHIEEAAACTLDDYILAWDYALGVRIKEDGSVQAVRLMHATAIDPRNPPDTVRNGKGHAAQIKRRQKALADDMAETGRIIAGLLARLRERPNDAE